MLRLGGGLSPQKVILCGLGKVALLRILQEQTIRKLLDVLSLSRLGPVILIEAFKNVIGRVLQSWVEKPTHSLRVRMVSGRIW
jgi:hypothetical protein